MVLDFKVLCLYCFSGCAYNVCIRIDQNGDMTIDWTEWRDFFELCSAETLTDLAVAWRHSLVSTPSAFTNLLR